MDLYKEKYEAVMLDIDTALLGTRDENTKIVLEDIKQRNSESEDERIINRIINLLHTGGYLEEPDRTTAFAWLEKQKEHTPSTEKIELNSLAFLEQLGYTCIPPKEQKPAEWSEEDEIGLNDALDCVEKARKVAKDENDMGNCWYAEKWLKSLRPHWKPSEEQMEALDKALDYLPEGDMYDLVSDLYYNLKKLM